MNDRTGNRAKNSADDLPVEVDKPAPDSWWRRRRARIRQLFQKYRAKGKWFFAGFILFYLIRDTILYIIIPYFLTKEGISLYERMFGP
ncbi:MAG: hypothetical protein ACE5GA_03075 [Candidatus Zixiibacteriota bacterium]